MKGAVDESELADAERDVLLGVVGDAGDLSFSLCDSLHDEMAVVTPQVVKDNRYGCCLRAEPQLQVAFIVGRTFLGVGVEAAGGRALIKAFSASTPTTP